MTSIDNDDECLALIYFSEKKKTVFLLLLAFFMNLFLLSQAHQSIFIWIDTRDLLFVVAMVAGGSEHAIPSATQYINLNAKRENCRWNCLWNGKAQNN